MKKAPGDIIILQKCTKDSVRDVIVIFHCALLFTFLLWKGVGCWIVQTPLNLPVCLNFFFFFKNSPLFNWLKS